MKNAAFIFCFASALMMKAQDVLDIPRISIIEFDGEVSEEEWGRIPKLPMIQHLPVLGVDPTEKTDVYFAYDDQYIYLAGRMYFDDVSELQNTTKQRDALEGSTEYFWARSRHI